MIAKNVLTAKVANLADGHFLARISEREKRNEKKAPLSLDYPFNPFSDLGAGQTNEGLVVSQR